MKKRSMPKLKELLPRQEQERISKAFKEEETFRSLTSQVTAKDPIHPWVSVTQEEVVPVGEHTLEVTDWPINEHLDCQWLDVEDALNDCYGVYKQEFNRSVTLHKKGEDSYVKATYYSEGGKDRWRLELHITSSEDKDAFIHQIGVEKNAESRRLKLVSDLRTVMETFLCFYGVDGKDFPPKNLEWYEIDDIGGV